MKRLCVYCGSSPGRRPGYADAARALACELTRRNIDLVYGGASVGTMGVIADAVLANGGQAYGVMPQALVDKEVAHEGLTELHVVASMHERKALMADLSDGFIALPGGWGTIEELFEVLTWAQLGFHHKPCGLLNAEGYYDRLSEFLAHTVDEGFVRERHQDLLCIEGDPVRLLDRMAEYQPQAIPKWIERDQT